MNTIFWLVMTVAVFAVGYYVGRRGLAGIESDLTAAKADIERLKNKVD